MKIKLLDRCWVKPEEGKLGNIHNRASDVGWIYWRLNNSNYVYHQFFTKIYLTDNNNNADYSIGYSDGWQMMTLYGRVILFKWLLFMCASNIYQENQHLWPFHNSNNFIWTHIFYCSDSSLPLTKHFDGLSLHIFDDVDFSKVLICVCMNQGGSFLG